MRESEVELETVERGFWPKFRRLAAQLPFADELLAGYYAAVDPETPSGVRAVLIGALAYFVMPMDLVPDFVIGLGFTDDAVVLATAIRSIAGHVQPQHRARAAETISDLVRDG